MKLKTELEIKELATRYVATFWGVRKFAPVDNTVDDFKAGYTQAQQDLLSSASEGFEEWKAHNLSCHESARIHDLCERSYQAAKLSQAKEIEELKEEIRFLKASNARLDEARICHLEEKEKLHYQLRRLIEMRMSDKKYITGEICISCDKPNDATSVDDKDYYKVHSACLGSYNLIKDDGEVLRGYESIDEANQDAEELGLKSWKVIKRGHS